MWSSSSEHLCARSSAIGNVLHICGVFCSCTEPGNELCMWSSYSEPWVYYRLQHLLYREHYSLEQANSQEWPNPIQSTLALLSQPVFLVSDVTERLPRTGKFNVESNNLLRSDRKSVV